MGFLKKIYTLDVKCTIEPYSVGNVYGLSFTVSDELNRFRRIVPWQDFDHLENADRFVISEILFDALKQYADKYAHKDGAADD